MAATKTTRNKKRQLESLVFWAAQQQSTCPHCFELLLPNGTNSDVYDLTYNHSSGDYDHAKREERSGKLQGGTWMHRSCHRSMTIAVTKIWEYRKAK